jgi:hypothetical protein
MTDNTIPLIWIEGEPPKDGDEYLVGYTTGYYSFLALIYWDDVNEQWNFSHDCEVCGSVRPFDDVANTITHWIEIMVPESEGV